MPARDDVWGGRQGWRRGLAAAVVGMAVALVGLGLAPPASASTTIDLRGDYQCVSIAGGAHYPQEYVITTENETTGVVGGYDLGENGTGRFALSGLIEPATFTSTINQGTGYTAHATDLITGRPGHYGFNGTFTDSNGVSGSFDCTETKSLATAGPSPTPAPAPGNPERSTIASSIASPSQAFASVSHTIVNVAVAGGVVLFITFPAQLFNHTFEENYADIAAWRRRRLQLLGLGRDEEPEPEDSGADQPSVEPEPDSAADRDATTVETLAAAAAAATALPAAVVVATASDADAGDAAAADTADATESTEHPEEHPEELADFDDPESPTDTTRRRTITAAVILLGALLGGLLDPRFGFNGTSATSYTAIICSTLLGITLSTYVAHRYRLLHHKSTRFRIKAIPAGLAIALLCLVVSRFSAFRPGYLYGLIYGVGFAGTLDKRQKGHTVALTTLGSATAALVAWALWVPVNHFAAHTGAVWPLVFLDDFFGAVFTGGLVGATIGSLPLRFLPGGAVASWHKGAWAALSGFVTFLFVAIILNPSKGGHSGHASVVTAIILFVVFGGGSVGFYAHFNRKKKGQAGGDAGSGGETATTDTEEGAPGRKTSEPQAAGAEVTP